MEVWPQVKLRPVPRNAVCGNRRRAFRPGTGNKAGDANNSNFTVAEEGYLRAIDCARRQNALAWELRATMSLARLLTMIGRKEEGKASGCVFAL
ncbi:MAG TPA: hypothetical protein VE422_05475 [Terriglobia bacterium]|nr:hypothetical protein [Terriglobia bacterium]